MHGTKRGALSALLAILLCLLLSAAFGCAAPEKTPKDPPQEERTPVSPTQAAPFAGLPAPYVEVLAQYAKAIENDYYKSLDAGERDAAFGQYVAFEWRANPRPAYYALLDLDGNGTDELFIGALEGGTPTIYDVLSVEDGQAARLFDLDFGYRTNMDVYADGTLKVSWSNSAFESGEDYYKAQGTAVELLASFTVTGDMGSPNKMRYAQDGAEISQDDFTARTGAYEAAGPQAFAWVSVADAGWPE